MKHKIITYLKLMRFHKPVGIWLLLWPVLWALWIASDGRPAIKNIVIFITGTILMRAAGCIINDIADRKFDKFVKRTASRPITAGEISVKEALILFSFLIILASFLVLQLNLLCRLLSVIAVGLACLYPFTKRWIFYPQLFLGLAFGIGVPMAFAAEVNQLPPICWLVFLIAVIWPVIYDTEYAMVDYADDIKIGLKSTAILFHPREIIILSLLQIFIIFLFMMLGAILKLNLIYFVSIFVTASLFIYQIILLKSQETENYFKAFLNNQWVGLIIFLGFFIPHLGLYWDDLKHFLQ